MDNGTASLVKSAFGPTQSLYSVLNTTASASQAELKRAYRLAALKYHPDRASAQSRGGQNCYDGASTLKFQAVSAVYQLLMDPHRRSVYDATGRVVDDAHGGEYGANEGQEKGGKVPRRRRRQTNRQQQQWEDFFYSVFNEIVTNGYNHENNAKSYRGSDQERSDVMKAWMLCKGDLNKVIDCVVFGSKDDIKRWSSEIIDPAIQRGEISDFLNSKKEPSRRNSTVEAPKKGTTLKRRRILEDSSSDDEISGRNKCPRRQQTVADSKIGKTFESNEKGLLCDTDDEDNNSVDQKQPHVHESKQSMSHRDKMDYRVAKKQKAKAEKEIEIARIIKSQNWGPSSNGANKGGTFRFSKKTGGMFNDALLSNLEQKYATKDKTKRKSSTSASATKKRG